jgi:acetoin utilization protein AcuB
MSLVISNAGQIQDFNHQENTDVPKVKKSNSTHDKFESSLAVTEDAHQQNNKNKSRQASHSYEKIKKGVPKKRVVILAEDIMSSPVRTIQKDKTTAQANTHLETHNYHHLPVLDGNILFGMLSDRDLICISRAQRHKTTVKDICQREVIAAKKDTELRIIAQIMLDERISSLPILDDENLLVGIITKTDILQCIVKNMPLELYI